MSKTEGRRGNADWTNLQGLFPGYLAGEAGPTDFLFGELLRVLRGFFRARLSAAEDCEELVQATLLKIHFARDRFDQRQSLKTWVFTIASRSLIDHWRGMALETELRLTINSQDGDSSSSPLDSVPSDLLDPAQKTELYRDLNAALNKLKPTERTIVYLYGVEEMTMKEIGQILSISEGAAKLRAHRAYQELRMILSSLPFLIFFILE